MSYTTQMDAARQGIITPEMKAVAASEHIAEEERTADARRRHGSALFSA